MTTRRAGAVILAALAWGAACTALLLSSDHLESKPVWTVFGPAVGLSFVGTGLYATRRRPESRTGNLMVLLGFAWFGSVLSSSNWAPLYSLGLLVGGLWGGVFLHLVLSFPSGRLAPGRDRRLAIAGYLTFTVTALPIMLVAGPAELACPECPANVLLVEPDQGLANAGFATVAVLYAVLFVAVLARLARRWRATRPLERLQLTPVYASGMLTFLLMTAVQSGGGRGVLWAGLVATALLPFAFLGGLLRSHVARLDAELRASRTRLVEAGDTARRRLERDLHDGAQARLVALSMLLGHARRTADTDPGRVPELLDEAMGELRTSLGELRELAHGIHPAVLTERGLDAALYGLASRATVPVTLDSRAGGRLPMPVEAAAYFVVSEALANIAKYSRATHADIAVRRSDGRLVVDVADDGVGGADPARGSGLRGIADRLAALDGTLTVDSPAGDGTRLHVEIPCGDSG